VLQYKESKYARFCCSVDCVVTAQYETEGRVHILILQMLYFFHCTNLFCLIVQLLEI